MKPTAPKAVKTKPSCGPHPVGRVVELPNYQANRFADLAIDVIHDGHYFPVEQPLQTLPGQILTDYHRERDWGAGLLARTLGQALGLPNYLHIDTARVFLDLGRYAGVQSHSHQALLRPAIYGPVARWFSPEQSEQLLEGYYRGFEQLIDNFLQGSRLKLAIHSYDRIGADGRLRPELSLITHYRVQEKQRAEPNPLLPEQLLNSTVDPQLCHSLVDSLTKGGYRVSLNDPYTLPAGAVELRYLARQFFRFLNRYQLKISSGEPKSLQKQLFESYLDSGLLSLTSRALFSEEIVHVPGADIRALQGFHQQLMEQKRLQEEEWISQFRNSPEFVQCLVIEVRKDLVWDFSVGEFGQPRLEAAEELARLIADGLCSYREQALVTDHLPI